MKTSLQDGLEGILPVFRPINEEYIQEQSKKIAEEYGISAEGVAETYRQTLSQRVKPYFGWKPQIGRNPITYEHLLKYAMAVDSIDRVVSVGEIGAGGLTIGATEIILVPELLESIPKIPLIPIIGYEFGWNKAIDLLVYEAVTLTPGIGDLMDLKNIYIEIVEKGIREQAYSNHISKRM